MGGGARWELSCGRCGWLLSCRGGAGSVGETASTSYSEELFSWNLGGGDNELSDHAKTKNGGVVRVSLSLASNHLAIFGEYYIIPLLPSPLKTSVRLYCPLP